MKKGRLELTPDSLDAYMRTGYLIISVGKGVYRLFADNGALSVMGLNHPNSLQIEPRTNNVIHLRVREFK